MGGEEEGVRERERERVIISCISFPFWHSATLRSVFLSVSLLLLFLCTYPAPAPPPLHPSQQRKRISVKYFNPVEEKKSFSFSSDSYFFYFF